MFATLRAKRRRAGDRPTVARLAFVTILLTTAVGIATEPALKASVGKGSVTEVQITGRAGIPSTATAVAVNMAAADPRDAGYLSAFPCGGAMPSTSTVNHDLRYATSNSAVVKIGTGGKICVYSMSPTDVIVDVTGWFTGSGYTSLDPVRLLDTRTTQRVAAGTTRELQVTGRAGIPSGATAVAVNLAAVAPANAGFLTAFPCGGAVSSTSTVNHDLRYATSNSAIVKIGTGGKICVYSMSSTDVVVDATGWFGSGSGYTSLDPVRFIDTRATQRVGSRGTQEVQITGRSGIPSSASAVAVNLAAVDPSANGYLSAFPCGGATPTTSTVNYDTSHATSNSAIVKIGTGGKICIYSMSSTDVVVDVTGWFAAGSSYSALDPGRVLDTRGAEPAGPSPTVVGARFVETFDGNRGLDRFRYGVYHRGVGYHEAGTPVPSGIDNNASAAGVWTGDHDLACGPPDTQRVLRSDFRQDTSGANGWKPWIDFHTEDLVYACRDHIMSSMGDIAAYSVLWFSPDMVFADVGAVSFDVNLTDLGDRKWWKVGVVSDALFNSSYTAGYAGLRVPGFLVSDVGSADLRGGLAGSDRLLATWSGGASAGYPGAMKIGETRVNCSFNAGSDKMTRFPVSLVDNNNGTVTFTVAGSSCTTAGAFPGCPCRVVFYDHNYTPDKDGIPIGHTWHWDNIIVR